MYVFVFACLFTANAGNATNSVSKPPKVQYPPVTQHNNQVSPKDCVKHPLIVKTNTAATRPVDKSKVVADNKVAKVVPINKGANNIPHFSVLNFINFFYSKDSLDNLHVM